MFNGDVERGGIFVSDFATESVSSNPCKVSVMKLRYLTMVLRRVLQSQVGQLSVRGVS